METPEKQTQDGEKALTHISLNHYFFNMFNIFINFRRFVYMCLWFRYRLPCYFQRNDCDLTFFHVRFVIFQNILILLNSGKPKHVLFERDRIGTTIEARENITVTMVANPKPDIEWSRFTGHDWQVTLLQNNKYFGFSLLTIKNQDSFGNYAVQICNRYGCEKKNVTLVAEGNLFNYSVQFDC